MRGGARKGAGRKPGLNKISYATKLSRWIVAWLQTRTNQSKTIETALVKCYRLHKPGPKTKIPEANKVWLTQATIDLAEKLNPTRISDQKKLGRMIKELKEIRCYEQKAADKKRKQ